MKTVSKAWGIETWLVNESYCGKILRIMPGWRCSLHFHPIKDETFYVLEGRVTIEIDGDVKNLYPGHVVRITPGTKHRFASFGGATILEISSHHDDDDVVRLEQSSLMPLEVAT